MAIIKKRTHKEIEDDIKRIKEAAKTVTSMTEIETITGLSRQQINTTLSKHPVIAKRIKEQIANNKTFAESFKTKLSNETDKVDTQTKPVIETKSEVEDEKTHSNSSTDSVKRFVIDASVTATQNIRERLENIIASGNKLVLTSISISEIENLQKTKNKCTRQDARYILRLAVVNSEHFEFVVIDESIGEPDDCIVHYCKEQCINPVLLTADKGMAVRAHMHGVKVEFFNKSNEYKLEEERIYNSNNQHFGQTVLSPEITKTLNSSMAIAKPETSATVQKKVPTATTTFIQDDNSSMPDKKSRELGISKNDKDELVIETFHTPTRSIRVWSRGDQIYDKGPCRLLVGDKVMVAKLVGNEIVFQVFAIYSLSSGDNHKLLFHKTFPASTKHFYISDEHYRAFLYAFKKRITA